MALYSDPPPLYPPSEDKPALLVCWWITSFCAVIILLRLAGRLVRTERLFREDKTAALALVPMCLRMGCVHVILIWGTNNAQLAHAGLSAEQLHHRAVASGLVLLSRVLYAATLWILKHAILEFFRRLNANWERSYEISLVLVRAVLITTFIAVVVSSLAECQPFSHYWQVLPDPGGQCRQGYAQLLTMAVCNVVTDLLLVIFPVPVILGSSMTVKRKLQLVLLFSLSLAPVAVTLYRVPHIIEARGSQQARSLYASVELLFATGAANALVLGSFVRDRGIKKRKYKYDSIACASLDRSSATKSRRPAVLRQWGSDEDLVREMGYGVKPELRNTQPSPTTGNRQYIPAPMVKPHGDMMVSWQFPGQGPTSTARSDEPGGDRSTTRDSMATPRRVCFSGYRGLLDDSKAESSTSTSSDKPPTAMPDPAVLAGPRGFRRGSTAVLQDIGGLLSPASSSEPVRPRAQAQSGGGGTELQQAPSSPPPAYHESSSSGNPDLELMDVGGLLAGAAG